MSQLRNPAAVARATGCTVNAVAAILPTLLDRLMCHPNCTSDVVVGALATVATECDFVPSVEDSDGRAYEMCANLGNTSPGDGLLYIGRGISQLTGKHNYAYYGEVCGYDLLHNKDLLLTSPCGETVFAEVFYDLGSAAASRCQDWKYARQLYNGGLNGWDRFITCVCALLPLASQMYEGEI